MPGGPPSVAPVHSPLHLYPSRLDVSNPELRSLADRRFEAALARAAARDPREFYRQQLRALREANPVAYREAVAYYECQLIPAVAADDSDPLREWLEYGRLLAQLALAGRTVQIDPTGRAQDYAAPVPEDHLVLHLPHSPRGPVLVVGLPATLSAAQRATYQLLVSGLHR
jgi:hypothetical protein